MGNIPSDPIILLSFVNMNLRDEGLSLDNFCERYDTKRQDLCEKLAAAGFRYDSSSNSFR